MIPLVGPGGLWTRWGHWLGWLNAVNTYRGTTLPARTALADTDFNTTDQAVIDGLYAQLSAAQQGFSILSYVQSQMAATLQQMVTDDGLQYGTGLSYNLNYLIGQMKGASQTVKRSVVGSSTAAGGTNVGNAGLVIGLVDNDGLPSENAYAETIKFTTTADAQSGGATLGQESLSFAGQLAQADALNWNWPDGSGCSGSVQMISGGAYGAGGTQNWLQDGDFEAWATPSAAPPNWSIVTGTAGTTITRSATAYDGQYALGIVGNGSELTAIEQTFGSATGSNVPIMTLPLQSFIFGLWAKTTNTPAAGALRISLVDQNGTVLVDAQGAANSVTVSLTSLGTTYTFIGGLFRTPAVLPTGTNPSVSLKVGLSTALSAGTTLLVDRISFCQPTLAYAGGPRFGIFSGNVGTILGDLWTATITNTPGLFQQQLNRTLGTAGLGFKFPSSASPTISDALIT